MSLKLMENIPTIPRPSKTCLVFFDFLRTFDWHIAEIHPGDSGTLEFSIPQVNSDDFFPVRVSFASEALYSGLHVESVLSQSGEALEFSAEHVMIAEEFTIG
jgi:hypothetical protein